MNTGQMTKKFNWECKGKIYSLIFD